MIKQCCKYFSFYHINANHCQRLLSLYLRLICCFFIPLSYAATDNVTDSEKDTAETTIIGHVFDANSYEKLYLEHHRIQQSSHSVDYKDLKQYAFARKDINYHRERSKPNITFNSEHCNESFSITSLEDNVLSASYSNSCDEKNLSDSIRLGEPYVVDAGFDHFIRDNLSRISKADLVFDYPAPSRGSNIALKASRFDCSRLKTTLSDLLQSVPANINNQALWQQCVAVRAKNWLIARFLPPIYLAYAKDSRLALYSGRSNMSDAEGDYQDIAIFYFYPDS